MLTPWMARSLIRVRDLSKACVLGCFYFAFALESQGIHFGVAIFELLQYLELVESLSSLVAQIMIKLPKVFLKHLQIRVSAVSLGRSRQAVHFRITFTTF